MLVIVGFAAPVAGAQHGVKPQEGPVVVQVRDSGFHWGDAAVGAAAAIGAVCVAGVGFLLRAGSRGR